MYVNPFLLGVISVIVLELVALVIGSIYVSKKKKGEK